MKLLRKLMLVVAILVVINVVVPPISYPGGPSIQSDFPEID